jgi:serine/threonine protein kinase
MQAASKGSEHIVKFYHSFSQADTTYIVMELCELGVMSELASLWRTS